MPEEPTGTPNPPGPPPAGPRTEHDPGVPPNLRYLGVGVGLAMVALGFAALIFSDRAYGTLILLVCVGFGITLAAFGSRAGGSIFNFNVVGGAALAIVLYLLLYSFPINLTKGYARGKIENSSEMERVTGSARQSFLVGRAGQNADFEFVIFEDDATSPQLYFYFDAPDDGSIREFYIGCIDTKLVQGAISRNSTLVLALDDDPDQGPNLVDNQTGTRVGVLNKKICNQDEPGMPAGEVSWLPPVFGTAFAQEFGPVDLGTDIPQLESDDPYLRDVARSKLSSAKTLEEYQGTTAGWTIEDSSYRADLGRLVAWSSAIERDRSTAVLLANSLTPEQIDYIAQLTGQGDRTLRQFATDILDWLLESTGWPAGPADVRKGEIAAAVTAVLQGFAGTVSKPDVSFSEEDRLYNTLVAVAFAQCNIGAPQRQMILAAVQGLRERLQASGNAAKTLARAEAVERELQSCG